MDSQIKKQLKALAIYQIVGGILGIALTAWVLLQGRVVIDQTALRVTFFAVGLFVFSILCGRMLFRNVKRGLTVSLINQLLQVVFFAFGAYTYKYVSGLRIGIGFDMVGSWTFKFRAALSSFHFEVGTDTGQKFIGINLAALFLIFWIERLMEKTKGKV